MIKHIVFFKLKNENKKNNVEKLNQALLSLKSKIEVINSIETGINIAHSERAFDLSLIVMLENEQALEEYRNHPEHMKVLELIKEINDQIAVVDYKI